MVARGAEVLFECFGNPVHADSRLNDVNLVSLSERLGVRKKLLQPAMPARTIGLSYRHEKHGFESLRQNHDPYQAGDRLGRVRVRLQRAA